MILEIDAGNTRLKYRMISASGSQKGATVEIDNTDSIIELLKILEVQIDMSAVSRIRVASVRGDEFKKTFSESVDNKWQIQPEFSIVQSSCNGVTNAYSDINSMGVDRWLAILAAFASVNNACCVLDCGSAITFDWVDKDGLHQGGYIVPGKAMMQQSLALKTPALDVTLEDWGQVDPGNSTETAISHGILAMIKGFAGHCHALVGKVDSECSWILTGGDADLVSTQLSWPHTIEKDLVLDGLAISMP